MSCGLGLPRLPQQVVLLWARLKLIGFVARFFGERDQPLFQGTGLCETTPLEHGAAPFLRVGGSATGVLITDHCQEPRGDDY
jgi:hypothetical protein